MNQLLHHCSCSFRTGIPASLLLALCCLSTNSSAQSMPGEDLRSGLQATTSDGRTAVSINPAATGYDGSRSIRLWVYDPYGISEIRTQGMGLVWTLGSVGIGSSLQSVSFDELNLLRASQVLAFDLQRTSQSHVRLGIRGQIQYASAFSGASHLDFGLQMGMIIKLSPIVQIGSVLGNWIDAPASNSGSTGFRGSTGVSIRIFPHARILSDIERSRYFGTDFRLGLELFPISALSIRAGITSDPARISGGVMFAVKKLRLTMVIDRHNLLGLSRSAELEIVL